MKKLRVVVVGVGNMGKHHARNYSKMKLVDLVGICDTNENLGKEVAKTYNTRFYTNIEDLIKVEKPDAASIAVPTHLHYDIALKLLNYNVHLLIEKPLAESINKAKKIANIAKRKKIILAVGHIERFNPAIIKLQELVKEGKLGEILSIIAKRVGLFPPQVSDVNVVTDIAVHDLDIITNIIGKLPNSIFATGNGALTKGREDHSEIFLDYNTFGCFVQSNWITPIKIRTLSITGTNGYAELNFITQQLRLYKSNYLLTPYKGYKEYDEFVVKFGESEKVNLHIRKKEPLRLELENFIDCIINNNTPLVTAADGIKAIILAEAANNSIKKKKIIKLRKYE